MPANPLGVEHYVFEDLRRRLLDRGRRNPLLHFPHSRRRSIIRIVDEVPDLVLEHLCNDGRFRFKALPDPENEPQDEKTPEFRAALVKARLTDPAYLEEIQKITDDDPAAEDRRIRAERGLRDRLRVELGLPPRPKRAELDLTAYARVHGINPDFDLPEASDPLPEKHGDAWLQTLLFQDEAERWLERLAATARTIEQETGVNTLHLAFGFLEWFESESSETGLSAPLVLLPVSLEFRRASGSKREYQLIALDNRPQANLALQLRLSEDFGLDLPSWEAEANGTTLAEYFAAVDELVRPFRRWRVRRFVTLACFSSARAAMYRDLDPANWGGLSGGPTAHPLVRRLLWPVPDPSGPAVTARAEVYDFERRPELEQVAPVLVHDADSSQHSAIVDAMMGRNLVIEGPPGTGKSQTIANLIANFLHSGRTVLFVSEKMAALDVVKSRLDRVGLGDFCLVLHAANAKPSAVIEALRRRVAFTLPPPPTYSTASRQQAEHARVQIRSYLDALHRETGPEGETLHALIGLLTDLQQALPQLPDILKGCDSAFPQQIDAAMVAAARTRLQALEATVTAPNRPPDWNPAASPWRSLERHDLLPDERKALSEALEELVRNTRRLLEAVTHLARQIGEPADTMPLPALRRRIAAIGAVPDPDPAVDLRLLARLGSEQAVENGRWIAARLAELEAAAARLREAGVRDPAAIRSDDLFKAVELAKRAGLSTCRLDELPQLADAVVTALEMLDEHRHIVVELATELKLPPDMTVAALRAACEAACLAAQANPAWLPYRRQGLEQHATCLADAAARQEHIEERLRQASASLDLSKTTPAALEATAGVLRDAGFLSRFRAEYRAAKRFFAVRWRGGPMPHRTEQARLLKEAAEVLAERETLRADPELRRLLGALWDTTDPPLRLLAGAAAWQHRVRSTLADGNGKQLETAQLWIQLISLDEKALLRLGELFLPARKLCDVLAKVGLRDGLRWSALKPALQARADALAELAQIIAAANLSGEVSVADLQDLATAATRFHTAKAALAARDAEALLDGVSSDAETVTGICTFAERIFKELPSAAPVLLRDGWTQAITDLRACVETVKDALDGLEASLPPLRALGLSDFAARLEEKDCKHIHSVAEALLASCGELPAYLRFAVERDACLADPLGRLIIEAFEAKLIPPRHLSEALDWLIAWTLLRRQAQLDPATFRRTGAQLATLRQNFVTDDQKRLAWNAHQVAQALLGRSVPPGNYNKGSRYHTEGALLEKELAKKRKYLPVRELLDRAGGAVLALTPCLMMSPLTVAQYLKPGRLEFDVVIMDEASQIRPEDALGALLRAKQAIIVGDPKQLPPTSFFERQLAESSEPEEEDPPIDRVVAESVLDLAIVAFRPVRRLLWHYRSQHESLIAFSNREFYDNELVVFPSPRGPADELGIEVVQVDGRWQNRMNAEEAAAVARAVIAFTCKHPDRSCGIVAMNQPQQQLIEAEIELLAAGNARFAAYREYWEDQQERLFVKNLENVQGDERDVVFISLGWGRTPEGAMHQRFFPISRREDGHRRLNVLFTRARQKVVLFASLRPDDIVVEPGKTAPGVRILRDYLLYARDGILERGDPGLDRAESPFEEAVAHALKARGYDVALQVGVAGYRLDLAVRHPADRACFVLGIECDGATYHRAKSARDRDRLRQQALERLGWRLTRVWSTDWFRDPQGETDRLSAEIAKAIAASGSVVVPKAQPTPGAEPGSLQEPPSREAPTPPRLPPTDLAQALRAFREDVILQELPNSDPARCILREDMIRAIIASRLDDPEDFHRKIPLALRSATDARQLRYLEDICEIVAQHSPRA